MYSLGTTCTQTCMLCNFSNSSAGSSIFLRLVAASAVHDLPLPRSPPSAGPCAPVRHSGQSNQSGLYPLHDDIEISLPPPSATRNAQHHAGCPVHCSVPYYGAAVLCCHAPCCAVMQRVLCSGVCSGVTRPDVLCCAHLCPAAPHRTMLCFAMQESAALLCSAKGGGGRGAAFVLEHEKLINAPKTPTTKSMGPRVTPELKGHEERKQHFRISDGSGDRKVQAHRTKAYLDFGVHLGSAYLLARCTFGRPNIRLTNPKHHPNPNPNLEPISTPSRDVRRTHVKSGGLKVHVLHDNVRPFCGAAPNLRMTAAWPCL